MSSEIVVCVKGFIMHEGRVLIVKRAAIEEVGAGTWEFAGGKIEFEEELEDSLVREVKEETGLDVTVDRLLYATSFFSSETRKIIILKYLCTSHSNQVVLSEEHDDYMWLSKEELAQHLPPHIIQDLEKNNVLRLI